MPLSDANLVGNFDAAWVNEAAADYTARSNGFPAETFANRNEVVMYMENAHEANFDMWLATGVESYMETALTLIENMIGWAQASNSWSPVVFNDSYLSWQYPTSESDSTPTQYVLHEGRGFRVVAKIIAGFEIFPAWQAISDWGARYTAIKDFYIGHVWDKWWSRGVNGNFGRVNVWMTSHHARAGMWLNKVFPNANYQLIADAFFLDMTQLGRTSSYLKGLVHYGSHNGFNIPGTWGNTGSTSDHQHIDHVITLHIEAFKLGLYSNTGLTGVDHPNIDAESIQRWLNTLFWLATEKGAHTDWRDEFTGKLNGTTAALFSVGDSRPNIEMGFLKLLEFHTDQEDAENRALVKTGQFKRLSANWACLTYTKFAREGRLAYDIFNPFQNPTLPTLPPVGDASKIAQKNNNLKRRR